MLTAPGSRAHEQTVAVSKFQAEACTIRLRSGQIIFLSVSDFRVQCNLSTLISLKKGLDYLGDAGVFGPGAP
jgi:hypothetical protein